MPDISVTPANVLKGAGARVETFTAGATITAGQALYKDTTDSNRVKPGDCNSANAVVRTLLGVALNGASTGQPVQVQTGGRITIGGAVVSGTVYCMSGTPGGIRPVSDNVSGDFVSLIGVGISATQIEMSILNSGAAV